MRFVERTRSAPEPDREICAVAAASVATANPLPRRAIRGRFGPFLLYLYSKARFAASRCGRIVAAPLLLAAVAARADSWADIQKRGSLRWGNDAEGGAPYISHPPGNAAQLVGFEVDFAAALCGALGVKSEFVQYNWSNLIPALRQGGSFDVIIAGLERSKENVAQVAMSRPYYSFGQQLVVRADQPDSTTLTSLKGRKVGVLAATSSQHIAEAAGAQVVPYDDNVNYFRDLELGRLEAVLTDSPIAQVNVYGNSFLQLGGNPKLKAAGAPFEPAFYAVGVRDDDKVLLAKIDDAIQKLTSDGTLERIYRKYNLWNDGQESLKSWTTPASETRQERSALRDWRIYLPILLAASVTTIWVTCAGMTLAATWGLTLALARQYGPAPIQWLSVAYIEVFRGTPLLLQLYFIYFGLAQQLALKLSAAAAAVLALGLNYAATEAENYRAGIESVPRGQSEAAFSLGMTRALAIRRVILPQAIRISLPSVTNDFIAMFKDSSIVSVIGLVELTKQYLIRSLDAGDYLGMGLMTAAIYFAMSYAASIGARAVERRLSYDRR